MTATTEVGDTTATKAPSINDGGASSININAPYVFSNFTVTDMLENSTVQMNVTVPDKSSDRNTSVTVTENSIQYTSKTKNVTTNSQASLTDISKGEEYGTIPSMTPLQFQLGPRLQGVTQNIPSQRVQQHLLRHIQVKLELITEALVQIPPLLGNSKCWPGWRR